MGHWNHRVVERTIIDCGKPVRWLGIHECFYDDKTRWTDEPVTVEGETIEDLRETLERMLRALDKPIIHEPGKEDAA